jgi:hypothetical protein
VALVAEALRVVGTGGSFAGKLGVTVRCGDEKDVVVDDGLAAVAVDAGFAAVLVELVAARGVLLANAAKTGDKEKARRVIL